MLLKNLLGFKRDLHLCKWPTRTFYSATYFSFTAETIILRIGLYELELSKQNINERNL